MLEYPTALSRTSILFSRHILLACLLYKSSKSLKVDFPVGSGLTFKKLCVASQRKLQLIAL